MGRDLADGDHTLWGLGLRRASEILFGYLGDFNPRVVEALPESLAARRGEKLRRDQSASHLEAGAQQLFDGADTLGDEQRLFLAGLSAPQIARKSKQFHGFGVSSSLE